MIENDRIFLKFSLFYFMTKEIHQKNVVGNFLILHSGFPRSQEKRAGISKKYFCRSSSYFFTIPDSKRNLLIELLIVESTCMNAHLGN